MRPQPRWAVISVVPMVFGALWFVSGWTHGVVVGVLASIPGVVLCGAGASLLLWPGERHANYYLALCSSGSIVLAAALATVLGTDVALILLLGGVLCCLVAGYLALHQDSVPSEVPAPDIDLAMIAKAAVDEGILAFFVACSDIPRGAAVARERDELEQLESLSIRHGWRTAPDILHRPPEAPTQVSVNRIMRRGRPYSWVSFDSEYAPPECMPGAARWLEQQANGRVYARVFAHTDRPRPWLMCLHGYRMGTPMADFSLFDIERLHDELGLNVIMPILPLHGKRRETWLSGGRFLDGSLINLFHAETQAVWDIRRCLAWLRHAYVVENIGVLGYSLGGYNAALLSCVEPDLACVIAGIPLTNISATIWRNLPTVDRRYMAACGLNYQWVNDIMAPISPLHWQPLVGHEHRYIIAATGDQIVPPDQPEALRRHWGNPTMRWYQGTHLSARREDDVEAFVEYALRRDLA